MRTNFLLIAGTLPLHHQVPSTTQWRWPAVNVRDANNPEYREGTPLVFVVHALDGCEGSLGLHTMLAVGLALNEPVSITGLEGVYNSRSSIQVTLRSCVSSSLKSVSVWLYCCIKVMPRSDDSNHSKKSCRLFSTILCSKMPVQVDFSSERIGLQTQRPARNQSCQESNLRASAGARGQRPLDTLFEAVVANQTCVLLSICCLAA
jgi:hypothetical protein